MTPPAGHAAAYAAPSGIEGGKDEIMLALVVAPGASVTLQNVAIYAQKVAGISTATVHRSSARTAEDADRKGEEAGAPCARDTGGDLGPHRRGDREGRDDYERGSAELTGKIIRRVLQRNA